MLKLTFIFLIGIAYAVQTRIKIGSKSWGYQIDLNQGHNQRSEFSDENGIATGFYIYKNANETKKLEYRIDPNSMEPDISFDVLSIPSSMRQNNSTIVESSLNTTEDSNDVLAPTTNMTFDSIDSKQDFKGHMTLKVGNLSYNINFVTGDKNNIREETLSPNGMLYGRFNYMLQNSATKIVINYKFNSSSPDPEFEVSLFKTLDSESSSQPSYLSSNYRLGYQRNVPYSVPSHGTPASNSLASSSSSSSRNPARPSIHYPANEKIRSNPSNINPNWYYNRGKVYDP